MKSNSWVITRKETGELIGEFYSEENIKKFNKDKVIVESSYDYLCRINKEILGQCESKIEGLERIK